MRHETHFTYLNTPHFMDDTVLIHHGQVELRAVLAPVVPTIAVQEGRIPGIAWNTGLLRNYCKN